MRCEELTPCIYRPRIGTGVKLMIGAAGVSSYNGRTALRLFHSGNAARAYTWRVRVSVLCGVVVYVRVCVACMYVVWLCMYVSRRHLYACGVLSVHAFTYSSEE